jgi:RNase P subunit RPR2
MAGADALFLFKETRAHKYLHTLSKAEIHKVLEHHVPRLKEIRILATSLAPPEVHDEYMELRNRIVERARVDLQTEFKKKIPKNMKDTDAFGIYLRSM